MERLNYNRYVSDMLDLEREDLRLRVLRQQPLSQQDTRGFYTLAAAKIAKCAHSRDGHFCSNFDRHDER